jgi:DNA repair protein RecO (recombination protein O)
VIFRKSDGIVIGGINYSETSRIVKVYTRDFGKVSFIAKGARRKKSAFRGALETFNHIEAVYIFGKKELHTLAECYLFNDFVNLKRDLAKVAVAYRAATLVDETQPIEDANDALYDLLLNLLEQLDCRKSFGALAPAFQLKLLGLSGFMAPLDKCSECGSILDRHSGVFFNRTQSSINCGRAQCAPKASSIKISPGAFEILRKLIDVSIGQSHTIGLSGAQSKEIDKLLGKMFESALERKPRAGTIIDGLANA